MLQKTAIITGASRGVGLAIAKHLMKLGYRLGLLARNEQLLKSIKHSFIQEYNLDFRTAPVIMAIDVSNRLEVERAFTDFAEATGGISVLVNNAGILRKGTSNLDYDTLQELMNVNLFGSFNCTKAAAPIMIKQRSGYIFNIASAAGKAGYAKLGGYSASKFAMVGFGQSLLKELSEFGIKVTTLCPNLIASDMTENLGLMPSSKMIPVDDIAITIEYLLKLSDNTLVSDLSLDCRDLIR